MRNIKDLMGMDVMTVREGNRLGRLSGVEIDPVEGRLRYLRFDADGRREGGLLPWEAVHSIGHDAVTVDSAASVLETLPGEVRDHVTSQVGDRPVVTESGQRLGQISGYELDEVTGRITRYMVTPDAFFQRLAGRTLDLDPNVVRTFGRDAIIVADEVIPADAS
jgi:uncharacterized protein YrrD